MVNITQESPFSLSLSLLFQVLCSPAVVNTAVCRPSTEMVFKELVACGQMTAAPKAAATNQTH